MVFSSSLFLLYFLPIFLLLYWLSPKNTRNYIILIASILFYSWGAPKFVFVILGSTFIDFYIVRALYSTTNKQKKKQLLILSILINLGLLAYFKYANFFIENTNNLLQQLGVQSIAWTAVALPIGISFYTFQTLTYSIDVYRGAAKPLRKVSNYLLYIMSFPQMIAGPIVRFNSIADQIENRKETVNDKLMGFYRFSIGLAKKVLIANELGIQAHYILDDSLVNITTATAWVGILAYTFQIYFDFSGYSDMAIGLGRMMGFKFPENFNSPYTSKSITEFWRRWHITLGTFMRDYLYIPLGGSRVKSNARLYANLFLVFLLSGLWHGASWNFILWGLYHGLFLILDRLFLLNFFKKIGSILSILVTFIITVTGWVIFRLEQLSDIKVYLSKMYIFNPGAVAELTPAFKFTISVALIFSFITISRLGKRMENFVFNTSSYGLGKHVSFTILSLLFLMLSLASITSTGFNPFIYFRF